jgi:plasmid stability protein
MQYTIRRIPRAVDAALRRRARTRGKSLNEAAIEALSQGLGVDGRPVVRRDLGDIVNTWRKESAVEAALAAQDRVDEDLWK